MAMGNSNYGSDRVVWPFVLDSTNDAIVVSEDSGARTSTINVTGTANGSVFWNYYDTPYSPVASYSGSFWVWLLYELNNDATLTGTYSVAASTPTGSSLANSGATLSATGITSFTLEFANGSTTLDPRLMGFGASASNQTSTSLAVASPYSLYGVWQSPHAAHDKRDTRKQTAMSSSNDPVNAYRNAWQGHRRRVMNYRFLPAGHVRRWAAEDAALATKAGLPTGDINNAFADFLWDASVSNNDIIVVYDEGDEDLQVDSHTDKYEQVRFADEQQIQDLMGLIEDVPRGEEYDLTWHFASKLSDPEYKDP